MEEEVMNNNLHPNYVECFQAKELLQMLLENELPPVFKSQIDKLHPAEEELVIIMRKNNLPISLYKELIDWAHQVSSSNYKFSSPTYKTALDWMKKKYLLEAETAPICSTVEVEGETFPPMHVYHFSVLHHVKRLVQSKELLEGALWRFKPKFCPDSNERAYEQLNSGEWWELAERKMDHDLNLFGTAKPPGLHFVILPLILFDDSTLCDNIGHLLAQPILCTIGNICDDLRHQVQSWFILGMVLPYPKSSKERESDQSKKLTQEMYIKFYHNCLSAILMEVKELSSRKEGVRINVPHLGVVNFHFHLCLIIGDTKKGHDDMCGHYNSHSSNISRMVHDCDIPQSIGDDPYFKCQFVNKSSIEEIVNATIDVVDNRIVGKVTKAQEECRRISQHLVHPVYWDIPTGGCVHGIFACLPYKILHLFYLGLMKYLLHTLYNLCQVPKIVTDWYSICCGRQYHADTNIADTVINDEGNSEDSTNDSNEDNDSDVDSMVSNAHSNGGDKDSRPTVGFKKLKKLFNKSKFEKRFRVVTNAAHHQSDRQMPRAPFKNGVTDQTRLTGQEYPGLFLITLVAMKGMLHQHSKSLETSFAQLIFMTFSLECALTLDSYPVELLSHLDRIIPKYFDI
jgi:Plavaka transposase